MGECVEFPSKVIRFINEKAKKHFKLDKDRTECLCTSREFINPLSTRYTFELKVMHDVTASEAFYLSFAGAFCDGVPIEAKKSQVIVENNTLKELFFFQANKTIKDIPWDM